MSGCLILYLLRKYDLLAYIVPVCELCCFILTEGANWKKHKIYN